MQRRVVFNKAVVYIWVVLPLLLLFSFASVSRAEYKIVYSHDASLANQKKQFVDKNEDIWTLLQHGFSLNHHADRPEVKEQIEWFMAHRKYLRAAANNARPYMYYIVTQIKKRDLPLEFALLPFNESAYDPFAYSTSGAAGLWQMMPATATDFGLKQNWWYDGRRDVIASTNAALDYLVYLQNFFSANAMLTVAAYHAGQGTVLSAVKKNASNGESTDFWSLPLGKQTQLYIPKLLALAEMIAHAEKYGLDLPPVPNKPYLSQVNVGSQIDLAKAAKLGGLSLSELKNLNPGFNRWATSPDGPYFLLVPIQNEERLRKGLELLSKENRVTWERYDVQSGDTLSKIAAKYHTTMAILQEVNKLDAPLIHEGDVLFIPNPSSKPTQVKEIMEATKEVESNQSDMIQSELDSHFDSNSHFPLDSVKENDSLANSPPPVAVYLVRKGDTLMSIAKTLNIPWKELREYNHLESNDLKLGQKLNIPPLIIDRTFSVKPKTELIHYVVQKKDTLEKIARQFNVSVKDIQTWNPSLKTSAILSLKQKLIIYQAVAE